LSLLAQSSVCSYVLFIVLFIVLFVVLLFASCSCLRSRDRGVPRVPNLQYLDIKVLRAGCG
jgi:membrane-anchored protein YejM (alkaline phosphatase superfamily)